jgi:hypothetical protein
MGSQDMNTSTRIRHASNTGESRIGAVFLIVRAPCPTGCSCNEGIAIRSANPREVLCLFACTAGGIAEEKISHIFGHVQYGTDANVPKERCFTVNLKKSDDEDFHGRINAR